MAKRPIKPVIFVLAAFALLLCCFSYQASQTKKAKAAVEADDRRVVQQAVEQYTKDNGEPPQNVVDLVRKGYLKALPGEPPGLISN